MIRVVKDDITKVTEFDAIVNCANNSLLGGGGIDGMIHRAAGPQLRTECRRLNGCETGDSRLTYGYELPCDYIIHSVGPVWMGGTAGEKDLLKSCYTSALTIAADNKIRRLAFCSISTGELGYPVERASKVAVATVYDFVKKNPDAFDDICWVVPDELSLKAYSEEIKAVVPKKKPVKKAKTSESEEKSEETGSDEVIEEAAEETGAEIEETEETGSEEVMEETADETVSEEVIEETADATDSEEAAEDTDTEEVAEEASKEATVEVSVEESATDDIAEEVSDSSEDENVEETADNASVEKSEEKNTEEAALQSADDVADIDSEAAESPSVPTAFDDLKYWNRYDIDWLISEAEQGNTHKYVCFWHDTAGSDNSVLSSWHKGKPIVINGRKYVTVEQYMISEQALLFGDFDSYKIIMDEPDPQKCKKAGRNIRNYDEKTWRSAFREIIFRGYYMRALCDEEFANALLATGDDVLIEASPFDDVYGAGMKESDLVTPDGTLKVPPREWRAYKSEKQGENVLGFVLMGVRDYLKKLQE